MSEQPKGVKTLVCRPDSLGLQWTTSGDVWIGLKRRIERPLSPW